MGPVVDNQSQTNTVLRINIEEYFNKIINQIDIDTEILLLKIRKQDENNAKLKIDKLNNHRENLIKIVNNFKQKTKDRYVLNVEKIQRCENADKVLFSECCFYLDIETLDKYILDNNTLGLVVFTQFYFGDDDCKKFTNLMRKFFKKEQQYDEAQTEKPGIFKYICIMEEIKKAITKSQTTVTINSTVFDEVKSIAIKSLTRCYFSDNKMDCFKNLNKIELNNADLSPSENDSKNSEPLYLFQLENLRILFLKYCKMLVLTKREVFFASRRLEELYIYNSELVVPNDSIFSHLEELKSFNFKESTLTYSPRFGLFSHNSKLKALNIVRPFNPRIEVASIEHLKNLEEISLGISDIDSNPTNISKFYEFISEQSSLTTLNLEGQFDLDKFSNIPSTIKNLSISEITISNENFNILESFQHLETLKLRGFSFVCENLNFDEFIKYLTSLKVLEIRFQYQYQQESVIQEILTSLTSQLYKIGLAGVNLECINELKINQLNLNEIYLKTCSLESIGNGVFKGMVNLKILNLSENQIRYISNDAFKDLSNLVELDLSWNYIKEIDEHMLSPLGKLEKLILNNNEVEYIDTNAFENLVNLKSLDLENNKIDKLEYSHLKHLSNLEYLLLSYNLLERVDGLFLNLIKIKRIDASYNKISNIDLSCFVYGFEFLEELDFDGNEEIEQIDENILCYLVNTRSIFIDLNWTLDMIEKIQLKTCQVKFEN